MKLWRQPDNYNGASWADYYVFLHEYKDSDSLERRNFRVALRRLGGQSLDERGTTVVGVVHEGGQEDHLDTGEGWVKWIAIHKAAADKVLLAEEMEAELDEYPILHSIEWSHPFAHLKATLQSLFRTQVQGSERKAGAESL
jgi:hypothetical protein